MSQNPNASQHAATCFDSLAKPLSALGDSFATLHQQLEQLQHVNDSLIQFNNAFGAFMFGLAAQTSPLHWPEAPTTESFERYQQQQNTTTTAAAADTKDSTHRRSGNETPPPRKFAIKINIRRIIDKLPLKFREQTEHTKNMEALLKVLRTNPDGFTMPEIVNAVKLPKHRVTECLNALVYSKDVVKHYRRGQLGIYKFDPVRYPSKPVSSSS